MDRLTILSMAVGLAMDAFAVSVTSGLSVHRLHASYALKIAFYFGLFQGLMPIIGWLAGIGLVGFISEVDHWIAFFLLALVGARMIYVAAFMNDDDDPCGGEPLQFAALISLALATSIDALAVGVSLSFVGLSIFYPALVIGLVTFSLSFAGAYIGETFGHFFEKKIEITGGIILIAIGAKILAEHTLLSGPV